MISRLKLLHQKFDSKTTVWPLFEILFEKRRKTKQLDFAELLILIKLNYGDNQILLELLKRINEDNGISIIQLLITLSQPQKFKFVQNIDSWWISSSTLRKIPPRNIEIDCSMLLIEEKQDKKPATVFDHMTPLPNDLEREIKQVLDDRPLISLPNEMCLERKIKHVLDDSLARLHFKDTYMVQLIEEVISKYLLKFEQERVECKKPIQFEKSMQRIFREVLLFVHILKQSEIVHILDLLLNYRSNTILENFEYKLREYLKTVLHYYFTSNSRTFPISIYFEQISNEPRLCLPLYLGGTKMSKRCSDARQLGLNYLDKFNLKFEDVSLQTLTQKCLFLETQAFLVAKTESENLLRLILSHDQQVLDIENLTNFKCSFDFLIEFQLSIIDLSKLLNRVGKIKIQCSNAEMYLFLTSFHSFLFDWISIEIKGKIVQVVDDCQTIFEIKNAFMEYTRLSKEEFCATSLQIELLERLLNSIVDEHSQKFIQYRNFYLKSLEKTRFGGNFIKLYDFSGLLKF